MFRKSKTEETKVPKGTLGYMEVDGEMVRKLCAYNDHGTLCDRYGTLSPSTNGKGPWYCRDHAWVFLMDDRRKREVPPDKEPMSEVDKRVNKLVPRKDGESEHDWSMRCRDYVLAAVRNMSKPGNRDWAYKILARQAAGEQMPFASIKLANEALATERVREPGEDESESQNVLVSGD